MKKNVKYELVDCMDALSIAIEHLSGFTSLALDIEMENNYHHYGLHIALIQVSTPDGRTLIFDPLAKINMEPLGSLLADIDIELIIHDSNFDKRACRRIYDWNLQNVFDTKIAAQLCGIRQYGLAALLNSLLNVETNKKFQRIDWLKRPLKEDALNYAAVETAFLFRIRDILTERLIQLGRLSWAREEFSRIETFEEPSSNKPAYSRIKGSSALNPRQLAVLESLAKFRERQAKKLGRPVHFIIRNKTMVELAVSQPREMTSLQKVHGMHSSFYRSAHARSLIEAVEQGLQGPAVTRPAEKEGQASVPGYSKRLKTMQRWRARVAKNLDIEPYLLLPNNVLGWCARNPGRTLPVSIKSLIRDWQRGLIWDDFLKRFSILESSSPPSKDDNILTGEKPVAR